MRADAGVEAYAVDDGLGVQAFHFGVGVQFVEVADTQGEVGVGEEFNCLCFCRSHEQDVDVFLNRSFLQEGGKGVGGFIQAFVPFGSAHDDAAGVKVVIQGLALPQELGREDDVARVHLLANHLRIAHGDGAFDDHDGIGVDAHHQLYHFFHMTRVEIILHGVIVGGSGNDHEVRVAVCLGSIQRGGQVQVLLRQVLLDVLVLDGRLAPVDEVHLLRYHVYRRHLMVLAEKRGYTKSYVTCSGYGYLYVLVHNNYSSMLYNYCLTFFWMSCLAFFALGAMRF